MSNEHNKNTASVSESEEIDEAMPMGAISRGLNKFVANRTTLAPGMAAKAAGRLDTGKRANELMVKFKRFLGSSGQTPTAENLIFFLKKANLPTDAAIRMLSSYNSSIEGYGRTEPTPSPTAPVTPVAENNSQNMRKLLDLVTEAAVAPGLNDKQIGAALMAAVQEYYATNYGSSATTAPTAAPAAPATPTAPAAPATLATELTTIANALARATPDQILLVKNALGLR